MEYRITVRLDEAAYLEIERRAHRRGLKSAQWGRDAWARELGRETSLDEIGDLRSELSERLAKLEETVAGIDERVRRIENRMH